MNANSPILLFRLGGLGDLLVALPSIVYLRKIMPGRSLVLVCRKEYGLLLREAGAVDEIVPLDGRQARPFFSGLRGADPETLNWIKGFSHAVAWLQWPPDAEMKEMWESSGMPPFHGVFVPAALSVPAHRYFFDQTASLFPGNGRNRPVFEECARLLGGGSTGEHEWPASPCSGPKRYFVIHPGSGGESKRWPLGGFLEIVSRLGRRNVPGFLVTGEAEAGFFDRISKQSLPEGWTWIREPSVLRLARLLAGASFYVGNDSGVTHLAAACGTRVLALFREDLEQVWKPYGQCRLLAAPSLSEIGIDQVWKAVAEENGFF